MKNYKKAILASLATIGASCALIGGATFALFTSDSTTNIAVTSGRVDVQAEVLTETIELYSMGEKMEETFATGGTANYDEDTNKFDINGMVAGDYIKFQVEIVNYSTVAVKYQSVVSFDGDADLFKALDLTIGEFEFVGMSDTFYTNWATLEKGEEGYTMEVSMGIPEEYQDKIVNGDDTNSIQGKECEVIFNVAAVQGNANVYDPVAPNPEWDGENIEDVADFLAFRDAVNGGDTFSGKTVTLKADLDLGGIANWEPIGTSAYPFRGTFEGGNKTISNLTVNFPEMNYVGLFGLLNGHVNNVTISKANVTGKEAVGVAVGDSFNVGYISGVTVLDSSAAGLKNVGGIVGSGYTHITGCTVDGFTGVATPANNDDGDKVGGIVGYSADSNYTIKDCTVKNANLTAYRDLGAVAGAYNGANVLTQVTGITVEKVTLTVDRTIFGGNNDVNVHQVIGRMTVGGDTDTINQNLLYTESVKDVTIEGVGEVVLAGWNYKEGKVDSFTGNIDGLTFKNITFTAPACFHTSNANVTMKGLTFEGCNFNLSTLDWETNSIIQAIRYYNENNNQKTTDIKVISCNFENCYQGVYTYNVANIEVTECTFENIHHNAIAIQDGGNGEKSHGDVIITNNKFTNIPERPIRFGHADVNTTIIITGNVANNAKDGAGEVIKGVIAEEIKAAAIISGNDWNGTGLDGVELIING